MIRRYSLAFVLAAVLAGLIIHWYQRSNVQKIGFILHDRQNDNEAQLAKEELLRMIETCGAAITREDDRVLISYRGFFLQKDWRLDLNP